MCAPICRFDDDDLFKKLGVTSANSKHLLAIDLISSDEHRNDLYPSSLPSPADDTDCCGREFLPPCTYVSAQNRIDVSETNNNFLLAINVTSIDGSADAVPAV